MGTIEPEKTAAPPVDSTAVAAGPEEPAAAEAPPEATVAGQAPVPDSAPAEALTLDAAVAEVDAVAASLAAGTHAELADVAGDAAAETVTEVDPPAEEKRPAPAARPLDPDETLAE
jgi:hypothetical protein